MVIKTFNVGEETYNKFSYYCKELGMSMSKQVDMFMKSQIEEEPRVKEAYLEKLAIIREGKFVKIKGTLMERYKNV